MHIRILVKNEVTFMIEQIKMVYAGYRLSKVVACLSLLLCAVLLFWFSGGFPPWAWVFLAQVIPIIPRLWAAQGAAMLLPLLGLILLSLALLILWGVLLVLFYRVVRDWLYERSDRERFARELEEAELLADQMVALEEAETQEQQAVVMQQQREMPQRMAVGGNSRPSYPPTRPIVARSVVSSGTATLPRTPTRPAAVQREQLRVLPRIEPLPDEDEHELALPAAYNDVAIEEQPTLPGLAKQTEPLPLQKEQLRLVVGIGLDPGIKRKDAPNEDNLFAIQATRMTPSGPEPVGLFVVADGMGGHANGQEASRVAIHAITDAVVPSLLHHVEDENQFAELLKDGVHRSNLALYQRNRGESDMMGTTLTAVLIVATTAYVVNVGDSRTYLYRPSKGLKQITRDHSVVARLVEDGTITKDEIYTHPKRNQIYRCLGEQAAVEIDSFVVPLQVDDVLMLCSDGLWEMVRDADIKRIMSSSAAHPTQLSSMLIQAALGRGGADNVSVVVVGLVQTDE